MSVPVRTPVPAEPVRSGRWRGRRTVAVAAAVGLAVGLIGFALTRPADAGTVGAGSYAETLPAGRSLPTGCGRSATNPRAVRDRQRARPGPCRPTTGGRRCCYKRTDCAFSEPLHAHPVSYDTVAGGLGFSYHTTAAISGSATGVGEYHYPYAQECVVGVGRAELARRQGGRLDATGPSRRTGATAPGTMRATIGHGLPFAYFQVTGGNAQISRDRHADRLVEQRATDRLHRRRARLRGVRADRRDLDGQRRHHSSTLAGRGYFSVAVLPTTPSTPAATRTAWPTRTARTRTPT